MQNLGVLQKNPQAIAFYWYYKTMNDKFVVGYWKFENRSIIG